MDGPRVIVSHDHHAIADTPDAITIRVDSGMASVGAIDTRKTPGSGDVPVVIRISEERHLAIKQQAVAEERRMAQVMRRALRQYLGLEAP